MDIKNYKNQLYKAVFLDVDGTLIKKDQSISHKTLDTIKNLKGKNYLVVLASARPLSGLSPIAKKLGLINDPLISLNGAYIALGGNIIYDVTIDAKLSQRLHLQISEYRATIIYYDKDKWFSESKNYDTDYEQNITSVPLIFQPFNKTFLSWTKNHTGPNKILVVSEEGIIKEMENKLKQQFSEYVNIYTSRPTYLEVIDKNASKLNGLKFIIKKFKIKKEETIAIGDNFNDKEMIEFAGLGIAMGNSPDSIKAVANYVTSSNNEDGVSHALIKFLKI